MDQAGLLPRARQEIDKVQWLPEWGKARIEGMLTDRPDWCISRQRTWGVPIALFVNKETGELHPDTPALIEQVAERVEKEGIDAWFDLDPAELLGEQADQYSKVTDTLDVVRFRCDPLLRAGSARATAGSGGPVSGRLGPAPWLVPVVTVDQPGDSRCGALQHRPDPRFYRGRAWPQDVQVGG